MIKQLNISNFQSHKDSSLDFVDGLNVIVGESDSGKSAILRALRWLIWNRPTGDAMRSNWGGKTEVEIFTDDAHIVRVRDKENEYILGDSHFKAVATDVPSEVAQVLNLNEINLQTQLSQPFLLSNTAGEVAQFFNKVAKLDKIDTGIANVNSAIRSLEQDIKYKTAEVEKQEEQLKGFDYLDQMEVDVRFLEELDKILRDTTIERGGLDNVIKRIDNATAGIEYYSDIISLEKEVLKIEKDIEKRNEIVENLDILDGLVGNINILRGKIKQQDKLLKLEEDVLNILELKQQANSLVERKGILYRLFITASGYNTQLKRKMSEIALFEAEFEKEMGDFCPLCSQPIKHKHNGTQ